MQEFTRIPHKIETVLQADETGFTEKPGAAILPLHRFPLLGRGIHYPIRTRRCSEAQEILLHSREGYPAGEMKHGPNALIDENLPVVVLATRDVIHPEAMTRYEKSVSNIKEVKARDGIVISIVTNGDHLAREASDPHHRTSPGTGAARALLEIYSSATACLSHRRAPSVATSISRATSRIRDG